MNSRARVELAPPPLALSLIEILTGVLGDCDCDFELPSPESDLSPTLDAAVRIEGPSPVEVWLALDRRLCQRLAEVVFSLESGAATVTELQDALLELTNQLAGIAKNLLPPPSQLALPRMVAGYHAVCGPEASPLLICSWSIDGVPIRYGLLRAHHRRG